MFSENVVKNLKYRQDLNRILKKPDATNGERLFLCCFCKDKLNWGEAEISNFIHNYNNWSNYDRAKTTRHINLIFERKARGLLIRKSSHSQIQVLSETRTEGNTGEEKRQIKSETVAVATERNESFFSHSPVFFVSPEDQEDYWRSVRIPEKCEEEKTTMEETKVFGQLNNGSRFYRIVEKSGKYGPFLSIDSGPLMEATTETGQPIKAFGRPDKYFSLPKEPEDIKKLIEILQKTIPEQEEEVRSKKKR